jgi:hypothetical protein
MFAIIAGFPLLVGGCGGGETIYPVSGTVHFEDGAPVPFGAIEFRNEKSGLSARGKLDRSGAFLLGTLSSNDGAPAGSYRVIIVQFFDSPPSGHSDKVRMEAEHEQHDPRADARVAAELSDYSTSPLRAEVSPNSENHFEFVVGRLRAELGSQNAETGS